MIPVIQVSQVLTQLGKTKQQLKQFERQLTSVSKAAQTATQTVASTVKATQTALTLLSFDEISRLSSASSKSASGKSSGSSSQTGKVKTGHNQIAGLAVEVPQLSKKWYQDFWLTLRTGIGSEEGSAEVGKTILERIAEGIGNALGSADQWVREHLLDPIQSAWDNLGLIALGVGAALTTTPGELWTSFCSGWLSSSRLVQIGNRLTNSAAALWAQFSGSWGSRAVSIVNRLTSTAATLWAQFSGGWGSRAVSIVNRLTSTAATLWAQFSGGWGSRTVSIVNRLTNTAASLWEQFRSGWAGKSLGLTVTYSTDVTGVKRAVYKALGLSGWPSIRFAARGGIVNAATLLPGGIVAGEAGAEAIIPLEQHTQWLDKVAERLSRKLSEGNGNAQQPIVIQVYPQLDGRTIGQCVVSYVNGQTRTTGVSPLYL